ncbi:MAG: methyltransferase domain-containing protein [Planctomycetota bacterium]
MTDTTDKQDHYLLGVDRDALHRYELFNEIYQPATAMRLATLDVQPDARVLEVGCGIGRTACYFAAEVVPDGHVVGFDQSDQLVELAKEFAAEQGIDNVSFFTAKAQDHDFEPASFDLAHTRYVLTYSPFAATAVARIYAALAPGGVFFAEEVTQDYVKHNAPPWCDKIYRWFERLVELSGGDPNYGRHGLPSHMLDAGFQDLTATAFTPIQDQAKIVEMLRLAVSNEFRHAIVDAKIATEQEVDACVDSMSRADPAAVISTATAFQVTGVRR